jgi:hypothetical protein
MHTTRFRPSRVASRFHWPTRHTGFETPLPPRRDRHRVVSVEPVTEPEVWDRLVGPPAVSGPLRQVIVLVLWLVAVLAIILLLAQLAD